jgi:hypothetical protein
VLPPHPAALSPDGERDLARVVTVLADAGVFAPRVPDPEHLRGPVGDQGEPVTADTVLAALDEVSYYRPGFDPSVYSANLAFHSSHSEQSADVLRAQVDDIVRLAGGGLDGVTAAIEVIERAGTGRVPTVIRLGDDRVLAYDGAAKYLSTELHVALARILRERRRSLRLACLWSDQGVWLSGLTEGTVERLNAALGPAAGSGWEWVDEQEPTAAGEMYPP